MSQHSTRFMVRSAEFPAPGEADDVPDLHLLDRFVLHGDERAFESLVRRHGPRVLRICRRILGSGQDADDAFQSTFVILLHRARSEPEIEVLDVWLSGVARRVAMRARQQLADRRRREEAPVEVDDVAGRIEAAPDDLSRTLRDELARLPEKYRRPIELYYLDGLNCDEAASRLNCATGTLKWRLSRGRGLLRSRLSRLGVALTMLLLFRYSRSARAENSGTIPPGSAELLPMSRRAASSKLPAELVRETVNLARFVRGTLPRPRTSLPEASRVVRRRGRRLSIAFLGAVLCLMFSAVALALSIQREFSEEWELSAALAPDSSSSHSCQVTKPDEPH